MTALAESTARKGNGEDAVAGSRCRQKEALCAVYWYKADLRSFLQQCLSNPIALATLNWDNYKRQIVSDLVDYLTRNREKHLGDLTRLCHEVCNITVFQHLEQIEGGAEKAKRAQCCGSTQATR